MERRNYAAFIVEKRAELIQKVSLVLPLADKLLEKGFISGEMYDNIASKGTTQDQMRELYRALNSQASRSALYEALEKEDPFLLKELEEQNLPQGLTSAPHTIDHGTQKYIEVWQKKSIKHRNTFEKLFKDPKLKKLGNGKLLVCITKDYQIGKGAEGTQVFIGMRDDGTEVAVKRMLKGNHEKLKDEMKLLRDRNVEHNNIVKYLDFTEDEYFYYLCLQLCECTLEQYKKLEELDQEALKKVVKEVLLGLQALHNADIIHRDIKPANILIDVEGNVRLADFGISRMVNQNASYVYTSKVGTRGWEAAESLNGDVKVEYRKSSDIQVAGMLVYYILSGRDHPFSKDGEIEKNIQKGNYQLDKTTDVEAIDLIEKMIAHEPQKRLSIAKAVDHPYFWDDNGRDAFLRKIGDMKPVQKFKDMDDELRKARALAEKYKQFSEWKHKVRDDIDSKLPNDLLGLLRFVRNRLVHKSDSFNENSMYKDLFPDLYVCANQLAIDMGWK